MGRREAGLAAALALGLAASCVSRPARLCDGETCSGHGACITDGEVATCVCDPGFVPVELACVEGHGCDGVTCSGRGACVEEGGVAVGCRCDAGFRPSSDGFHCLRCRDGDGDGVSACAGDCDDGSPFVRRCDCLAVGGNGFLDVYASSAPDHGLALAASVDEPGNVTAVAWGPWAGEPWDDLAVGRDLGQPVQIYRLSGGAAVEAWPRQADDPVHRARALAWADVDGDGDLDLAVGSDDDRPSGQSVQLYRNPGPGLPPSASRPEIVTPAAPGDSCAVAWGRWDLDDLPDLAVAKCSGEGEDDEPDRIYRSTGPGLELAPWRSPVLDDSRALGWADLDGDGHLDLAVGSEAAGLVVWGGRPGSPDSLTEAISEDGPAGVTSLAWADFDGDGDQDLAVAAADGAALLANERGALAAPRALGSPGVATAVAWGDLELDGRLEVAVLREGASGGRVVEVYAPDSPADPVVSIETPTATALAFGDCEGLRSEP